MTLDAGAAPGDRIDLGADITTGGGSIALESAVELTGDVVLDTGPGAGNVILAAAVDAAIADAQGLEVISGNGLISFGGLIGGANRLAFLRLDSAAQGFNMPQLSVALDLRLFAGGPVTQTGPLTGASVHVKTRGAVGAAITLTDENNNFGTVTLEARNAADGADAAGAISYRDTAGFTLGALGFGAAGIRTTAQAVLQSADAVNQAGAVIAAGLDLRGSGPYALGGAGNRVSALAADVTSNVVFTNQDQPLGLSAMIIGGNLEIRANGVNDSGPLAVQGTAFFDGRGDGVTLNGEGADANQFDGSVTLADGATGITLANNTFADAVTVSGAPTTLNAPPAVQPFVELIIGAAVTLNAELRITGDLVIQPVATLDVGAGNRRIALGGDWANLGGTFEPRQGTVVFFGNAAVRQVLGDNDFYGFVAVIDDSGVAGVGPADTLINSDPGVVFRFEQQRTQTIRADGRFVIHGGGAGWDPPLLPPAAGPYITLDSTAADTNPANYWRVSFASSVNLDLRYVYIDRSEADPAVFTPDLAHASADTIGWIVQLEIVASITVDRSGTGKLDAIRLTANTAAPASLPGFRVFVRGYQVAEVAFSAGPAPEELDINLVEQPFLDTGARPLWRLETPSGDPLLPATNLETVGGVEYHRPQDGAPPVIGYTLAIPGGNRVYVHLSEPVPGAVFQYSGAPVATAAAPGGTADQDYILTPAGSVTVAQILGGADLVSVTGIDQAGLAFLPARNSHRVSDLLLVSPDFEVVTPVFAREFGIERDATRGGIGLIRDFDGSAFLQPREILLQLFADGAELTIADLRLFYDSAVSPTLVANGLWLPDFDETDFSGLVPYPNDGSQGPKAPDSVNVDGNLLDFLFSPDARIRSGVMLDFFPRVAAGPPPLYAARLFNPGSTTWFRNVRPFSFRISEVLRQRGSVSILNNVINPENGEKATLHYELPRAGTVSINVFNLAGDLVDVIHRGRQQAGEHSTTWGGTNRQGRIVARGIYFIRVRGPDIDEYRKVMVVK
ncbi:MAG: hypothetical protein EA384_16855 [Spirochaetaceae bacterium]|nr:MAG: hypothetical protein EA384_16855 [Spirochaetaceae bacterium]